MKILFVRFVVAKLKSSLYGLKKSPRNWIVMRFTRKHMQLKYFNVTLI